ncbi:hypothetical protein H2198_003778 [Neophaeococcomyces mojaviensis]|uniref:Uncharacterized protein n=1 Tax=Neophaeococcomyces mojaviensis TaxID=3383035 RepID=A0ACC3AAK5_9EURO|nr:hypothetical protein H2198_003778 [Knufia sp. JES_112]
MAQLVNNSNATPVKNIAILGPTGNIGIQILKSFLEHNASHSSSPFNIIALTRDSSLAGTKKQLEPYLNLPHHNIQVKSIDSYTNQSALSALLRETSTEVLISTIATLSTNDQTSIIDACVSSGTVKRFFPSEFGVDTSSRPIVEKNLPVALFKLEVIEYLKKVASDTRGGFTWSAIICGAFFDWGLKLPGLLTFNLASNEVAVIDGGDVKYEATNIATIGRAVVACLANPKTYEESAGQYVYINSFTVTQNQVISLIESYTNRTIKRHDVSSVARAEEARKIMEENGGLEFFRNYVPTAEVPYAPGSAESILPCIYGGEKSGGMNQYSMREPGLWNERLGLPKEDVEETVRGVLKELGLTKA